MQKILKLSGLYILALIFTISNLNSINAFGTSHFLPLFEVMIIYYFTVYQKDVFGSLFIFLIGIWSDALNGLPIGMSALIYLLVVKIFNFIRQKQAVKEEFIPILQEFAAFISIILGLKWLILSIFHKDFYSFSPFFMQIIISCAAYIVIHKIFDVMTKKILNN